MKPEIAILLGAHQLLQENPTLTEDKAFGVAAQKYYEAQIELGRKLTTFKECLGDEWAQLVVMMAKRPSPEELETRYNEMLATQKLRDAIATADLELMVEHEGLQVPTMFPAGTKIKVTREHWDDNNEFIEVWTAPNCVDYTIRQNIFVSD